MLFFVKLHDFVSSWLKNWLNIYLYFVFNFVRADEFIMNYLAWVH